MSRTLGSGILDVFALKVLRIMLSSLDMVIGSNSGGDCVDRIHALRY